MFIWLHSYYCYINCCQRCRLFHMGNKRTRVAVTDKGRMMLWDSDLEGSRVGLTSGFTSDTTMEWYHIDDLNSLQVRILYHDFLTYFFTWQHAPPSIFRCLLEKKTNVDLSNCAASTATLSCGCFSVARIRTHHYCIS